ncbi:zinc-ribbon domain-containing protein [Sorangium sp. So ce448]|uniref:zinc-ribbon domain-containing protein n=1 Tax=Sorangium sp. So ce448 TaxID=3133314 RepID=UPI003F629381
MKITCESCQAKYTIADEKVAGKTVKIKCKKCNHSMVVHGANEAAPAAPQDATAEQQGDLSDDAEAKLVADVGGAPAAAPDTWTVNVAEGDERTMTTAELVAEYARGGLSNDTYVWKDGMGDWLPIASVPELKERFSSQEDAAPAPAAAVAAAAPAAAAPAIATPMPAAAARAAAAVPAAAAPAAAAASPPAGVSAPAAAPAPAAAAAPVPTAPAPAGLRFGPEGTVVMKDSRRALNQAGAATPAPAAVASAKAPEAAAPASPATAAPASPAAAAPAPGGAPAPAAARRAARGAAVDVFSAAERAEEPAASAPSAPPPGFDRQVGERNENSVLFSLSALTATENAAAAKQKEEDELPSGRRPSNRPSKNNGRAGYDDLLNLGGGPIASAPMLAPPPLLAPVTDSRPPPSMSLPSKASVPPASLSSLSPLTAPEASTKKGRTGLIAAAIAAVVLIGGVAFFFMQSPTPEASTATPEQANTAPAEVPSPAQTEAPAPTPAETAAAATPSTAETAAPSAEPTASAEAPSAATPAAATPAAATPAAATPAAAEKPASAPAAAAEKPAASKPEPAASGGAEFNRGAASSALGAAAGSAKSCKKAGGPTGTGRVKVTFAPSGSVTSAEVQGAPFAGTSVGGCVARLFRSARVPAFGGGSVSVSKSFTIN